MDLSGAQQLFLIALIAGLVLIGAEIFVPGGVLGAIAGVCLLTAMILGFAAFPQYGAYIAVGILVLTGVVIVLWIRFFPRSYIGKRMTVSRDLASFKGTQDGLRELVGKRGTSASDLRPSGFASIDGQRVDVVTEGGMISKGRPVRVVRVEGNRVIVRETES
jgi:membrane-bound serine protease (ClpP class)